MKKSIQWPVYVFLLFPMAGCHLIDIKDIIHNPDKVPQLCTIQKMTYNIPGSSSSQLVTTTFYYNKWGNPDSIRSTWSATGHPSRYYFRYDNQRRLVWYLSAFDEDNGGYWRWSRFSYDNKNRVIADSSYSFGLLVNNQPQYPIEPMYRHHTVYTYDAYDRITLAATSYVGIPNGHVRSYAYNSQGNRTNADGSVERTYDNKTNIWRTHKIWMFMMQDYSINNGIYQFQQQPTGYNQYGLPLNLSEYTSFLDLAIGGNTVITYKCK